MEGFGLYWWRPKRNWINLGDEISPLIFSHVTGQEVFHSSPDTCDGIAIGSIFNPRKAATRKRQTPLFVWGSGTLEPKSCDYNSLSVVMAALRGPLTAGQIAGCPDVPFGDPGLFVREIWPLGERASEKIGIIPHHSLLGREEIGKMADALGDTIIINFTDKNIEKTLQLFAKCKLIVSSSLHGLIIADSYGIPSLFWNELGVENEWKFRDYFKGVERPGYNAMTANDIIKVAAGDQWSSLPFSLLPEVSCMQCLSNLRKAAARVPC